MENAKKEGPPTADQKDSSDSWNPGCHVPDPPGSYPVCNPVPFPHPEPVEPVPTRFLSLPGSIRELAPSSPCDPDLAVTLPGHSRAFPHPMTAKLTSKDPQKD